MKSISLLSVEGPNGQFTYYGSREDEAPWLRYSEDGKALFEGPFESEELARARLSLIEPKLPIEAKDPVSHLTEKGATWVEYSHELWFTLELPLDELTYRAVRCRPRPKLRKLLEEGVTDELRLRSALQFTLEAPEVSDWEVSLPPDEMQYVFGRSNETSALLTYRACVRFYAHESIPRAKTCSVPVLRVRDMLTDTLCRLSSERIGAYL